jgi:hypothetical protein
MITVNLSLYLLGQTTLKKEKIERKKPVQMNSSTGTRYPKSLKAKVPFGSFFARHADSAYFTRIEGVSSTDLDPNPQLDVDSIVSQDQGVPQEKKKVRKFLVLKCWMFF